MRSRWWIALGIVVALLIGVRAALPVVLERFVNRKLDELKGYSGSVEDIDLSLALFDGSIVAEIELFAPKLNFVNAEKPSERQTEVESSWTDTVRDLVPSDINRIAIHNGQMDQPVRGTAHVRSRVQAQRSRAQAAERLLESLRKHRRQGGHTVDGCGVRSQRRQVSRLR